jgi:hypothetical protein
MVNREVLEKYSQVILHSGCALPPINETEPRKHRWDECREQRFYMRIARKHQHKLQSNGLAIGEWIKADDLTEMFEFQREFAYRDQATQDELKLADII